MKKIVAIVVIMLMLIGTLGFNQVYAETSVVEQKSESQLVKIKESTINTLDEYKEKYGSDAYGLTAFILNIMTINIICL